MNYDSGLSASDVALITGRNGIANGLNDMFGGNGAWFIILFLIFAIFGWGRNGFGGNGNNGNGGASNVTYVPYGLGCGGIGNAYTDASIQRGFDHQSIITKLDGITQGICDSTYALNNTITNGFNNTNVNLMQGFNGIDRGLCNLSSQVADCCCQTQRAIDGVNYNMAMNTNTIQQTLCNNTRDILENNNNNTRAILDFLTNDKISTLQSENQALKFQASQTAQNSYLTATIDASRAELIRRLGADCPTPAYVVQPPTPVTFPTNCCGQFTGYNNSCNSCCGIY